MSRGRELLGRCCSRSRSRSASRAFLIEPFRIPSDSMLPTLWIGDHLFVNKLVYGRAHPVHRAAPARLREPERGDVVVFSVAVDGERSIPADRRADLPSEDFVKRIIGLPGDRIDIVDGVVFVNGEPIARAPHGERFADDAGRALDVHARVAIGERHFAVLDDPELRATPGRRSRSSPAATSCSATTATTRRTAATGAPCGCAEIKGPAFLLYWSWDFSGSWLELLQPATWVSVRVRWDRIGRTIQ